MRKNKKLLMFLALNSLATSFAGTTNQVSAKYDKLYTNMVKNLETGKSNESNYKLIQDVLNKRNQELKDLYLQGDYVVKPEYLEWQVFFSAFYEENNRGDNTLASAKYYSDPEKANGDSTLANGQNIYSDEATNGHFKPYRQKEEEKFVDLGVSLNIKGITKNMSDINVTDINVPVITSSTINFTEPSSLVIPKIELVGFNPSTPKITTINFSEIPVLSLNGTGGGNGGITGFFPYGDQSGNNSIISQMDLTSGTITVKTAESPMNNDPNAWDYRNPGYYSYTLDNVLGNPSSGLTYNDRYDPISGLYIPAVLPVGIYSDSILNIPAVNYSSVQGVLKVIDNPITRFGTAGGNVNDLTITLEGDVQDAMYLEQILHYDEHYMGIPDPITGMSKTYTLDEQEANGWITASEKTELGDRFLDTTLGFTTANRPFQYVENNSTWNLKGGNVVAVNIQAHGGYSDADSIFMNRGNIIGLNEASSTNNQLGKQVAFMFTEGLSSRKQEGFDNTGTIEMRAPQSVVYLMTNNASSYSYSESSNSSGNNSVSDNPGKHFLYNDGEMKLYGNNNIGVYTNNASFINKSEYDQTSSGSWYKSKYANGGLQRSEIRFTTPLTVLGDQSIGIDIERELNFANSKMKVDIGTEDTKQAVASATGYNGLENSGNITGGNSLYTDSSAGIYVNMAGNIVIDSVDIYDELNPANNVSISKTFLSTPQFTLSDYLLNIGSYSRSGAGIRIEEYGDVILGSSTDSTTNHEINLLAGSEENAGIYLRGSNETSREVIPDPIWNPENSVIANVEGFVGARATTDGLILNINGNKQVGAQIEEYGYLYHKNGDINVNGIDNTGIAVKTLGYAELSGTGNINVGAHNLGVYNNETFDMTGGNIKSNGTAAVGVYSATSNTGTNLSGGTVRAENGGIGLYSDANSVMNLNQGLNLESGSKGLLFYNYDNTGALGKYNVTGTVGAKVETGGNAFYVKGGQSLNSYLTNSFTGTGNLDLTMNSGSKLYILEGKGTSMN